MYSKYGRRLIVKCINDTNIPMTADRKYLIDFIKKWININGIGYKFGKSPELLQCLKITPIKGEIGAVSVLELKKVYGLLGLKETKDYLIFRAHAIVPKIGDFHLSHADYTFKMRGMGVNHVVSLIIDPNGVYKLLDSATTSYPCEWRNENNIKRVLRKLYPAFAKNDFVYTQYSQVIYINTVKLPYFNMQAILSIPVGPREHLEVNSKGREIKTGPKGGKYVEVGG